jgi:pseudaminic acid cytidylyltransferase
MHIAIIPARGGSKRIPRKNVRLFRGKPMIAWSIEAALGSGLFEAVHVSTDDPEIAAVAQQYGACVPFIRPARLADDCAPLDAVIFAHVSQLAGAGVHPALCCCLFATAPFVTPALLQEGLRGLEAEETAQFAVAVARFGFPIQRAVHVTAEGRIQPFWPENIPKRSQDLEPAFHEAGQFYWARTNALRNHMSIYAGASVPVVVPSYRVQDIDTEEDWVRAECLHRALEEMS